MGAITAVLLALMAGMLLLIWREVRQRRTQRLIISRRRWVLRLAAGSLLFLLLLAIFIGISWLEMDTPQGHPIAFAAFWLGSIVLGFALIFIAIADMKEIEEHHDRKEAEIWREFALTLVGRKKSEKPGAEADNADARSDIDARGPSPGG